jgi:hypothetical protein
MSSIILAYEDTNLSVIQIMEVDVSRMSVMCPLSRLLMQQNP